MYCLAFFDAFMIYHENDKDRAETFMNIMRRCVQLKQDDMKLNICFDLNDLPCTDSSSTIIDYLAEAIRTSNIAFVICSEHDNTTNFWNEYQQQSVMMQVIVKRRILIVPVILPTTKKSNVSEYLKLYKPIELNDLIRNCSTVYRDLVDVNASELIIGKMDGNLSERMVGNLISLFKSRREIRQN